MGDGRFLFYLILFPVTCVHCAVQYSDLKVQNHHYFYCGVSKVTSTIKYCDGSRKCDRAGLILKSIDLPADPKTFAICSQQDAKVQLLVNPELSVWKTIKSIACLEIDGKQKVDVIFESNGLVISNASRTTDLRLRCVTDRPNLLDNYDFSELGSKTEEGYKPARLFIFYLFICIVLTAAICGTYYVIYVYLINQKLTKSIARRQIHHDELWLKIDRATRKGRPGYDLDEIWNAMPLVHQHIAVEGALLLQKYKNEKFTPDLREWLIDRAYPCGATEIMLELAGLGDPPIPTYAPEERTATNQNWQPDVKIAEFSERVEARIVDTLNYANRLRRRKIVFTDHRWLEIHHFFLELFLTSIGAPSHPTLDDAEIPILPRYAFGTRDDPIEEKKEEKENQARLRRPHFLTHDWDEATRLLSNEN